MLACCFADVLTYRRCRGGAGRPMASFEDYLRDEVMPLYGNTHSSGSACGIQVAHTLTHTLAHTLTHTLAHTLYLDAYLDAYLIP